MKYDFEITLKAAQHCIGDDVISSDCKNCPFSIYQGYDSDMCMERMAKALREIQNNYCLCKKGKEDDNQTCYS